MYGKNTTAPEGEYFRANIWYWHPLAEYLVEVAPELMEKVEYLHSNDGDGLDAEDSVALADILDREIANGGATTYVARRTAALDALPDETCDLCHGTGVRTDEIAVQHNLKGCNGCNNTGKRRPWETMYHADLEMIQEFTTFVRHSGGFQIF